MLSQIDIAEVDCTYTSDSEYSEYQVKFTKLYVACFAPVYQDRYKKYCRDSIIQGCSDDDADERARLFATEQAHEIATEYATELADVYMTQY